MPETQPRIIDWTSLSAPERNALIHEHVMQRAVLCTGRFMLVRLNDYSTPKSADYACLECKCEVTLTDLSQHARYVEGKVSHSVDVPDYTGDWNEAMEVFRSMVVGSSHDVTYTFTGLLQCDDMLGIVSIYQIAEWTPESVCRAALEAVHQDWHIV